MPHFLLILVDTESTVFPGEKHEIDKFCSTAMSTSKLQLTLNFPTMDLFFGYFFRLM